MKDILLESPRSIIWRACQEWLGWKGRGKFFDKRRMVDAIYLAGFEHGWEPGCGPDKRPLASFAPSVIFRMTVR